MAKESYGRYEVKKELGRGGMATVYVAHDPRFDRDVALKVLPPGFLQDPTFRERFDLEARFIAQLEHAAIVPVYDYGEDHGRPYLVMRLMLGGTVRDRINKGPLPLNEVVAITRRICSALEKAHSRRIIHRDIKPPNILCDEEGAAYLADFGIARLAEATQTVTAMGTPQYIAPEQVYGEPLDGRTDIYQLGVVLFEMLTGRPPFEADNAAGLIYQHVHERVPSARSFNPSLNAVADAVIERAMAKQKQDRYDTAGDFAAAVAKILSQRPGDRMSIDKTVQSPPTAISKMKGKPRLRRPRVRREKKREPETPPVPAPAPLETEPWAPLQPADLAGHRASEPKSPPPQDNGLELVDSDPKMPWEREEAKAEAESALPPPAPIEDAPSGPYFSIAAPPPLPIKPSRSRLGRILERRKYETALQERKERYRSYLTEQGTALRKLRDARLEALEQRNPSPTEHLTQLEKDPAALWKRKPQESDFLVLRVGYGMRPFPVTIDLAPAGPKNELDPLYQEALTLVNDCQQIERAPIVLPLSTCGLGVLTGPRVQVISLARAMLIQIAAQHRPDQVKIVALFSPAERTEWEWLRWLPHVWSDDRRQRFLACYKDAAQKLLQSLHDLLLTRDAGQTPSMPHYVLLLSDRSLVESNPILPLLLKDDSPLGAHTILIAEGLEGSRTGEAATLQVGSTLSQLTLSKQIEPIQLTPDEVPVLMAKRFARLMAPMRPSPHATQSEQPQPLTLLDILGVESVEALDVVSRWRDSEPWNNLSVPIGRTIDKEMAFLDIHEKAHGPHGLVTGIEEAIHNELLTTIIASLALHFHPRELAFLLVDLSGDGLADPFHDLPHLVGSLSGWDQDRTTHLLGSLKKESQRRRDLFADASVGHIDAYLKKSRSEKSLEPIPHLFLLVEESTQPVDGDADFMHELTALTGAGQQLGLHQLLATRNTSALHDEGARVRHGFHLDLSADRFGADRMRLLAGDGEIDQQIQIARSRMPYSTGGFAARDPHEILEVALDGSRQPLRVSTRPMRIEAVATQVEAIVAHIRSVAEREGIRALANLIA